MKTGGQIPIEKHYHSFSELLGTSPKFCSFVVIKMSEEMSDDINKNRLKLQRRSLRDAQVTLLRVLESAYQHQGLYIVMGNATTFYNSKYYAPSTLNNDNSPSSSKLRSDILENQNL